MSPKVILLVNLMRIHWKIFKKRENSSEVIKIIYVRDDCVLNQVGSSRASEKWLGFTKELYLLCVCVCETSWLIPGFSSEQLQEWSWHFRRQRLMGEGEGFVSILLIVEDMWSKIAFYLAMWRPLGTLTWTGFSRQLETKHNWRSFKSE